MHYLVITFIMLIFVWVKKEEKEKKKKACGGFYWLVDYTHILSAIITAMSIQASQEKAVGQKLKKCNQMVKRT